MSGRPARAAPPAPGAAARPAVPPRPGNARGPDGAAPQVCQAEQEVQSATATRPSPPRVGPATPPPPSSPPQLPPPPPPRPAAAASATTSASTATSATAAVSAVTNTTTIAGAATSATAAVSAETSTATEAAASAATSAAPTTTASATASATKSATTSSGLAAIVLDAVAARDLAQLSQLDLESGVAAIELALDFLEWPVDEAAVHEALGVLSARSGAKFTTVEACARGLVSVLGDALRDGRRPGQVQAAFEEAGCGAPISAAAGEQWAARLAGLLRARARRVLHVNRLVDCDWQLGLTLATNEIDSVGAPFLHLRLDMDPGNGELRRELVELSLPRFNELLAAVEQARAQLDALDKPLASPD
jgi:hypothetical protein